jgi:hypothetical protein
LLLEKRPSDNALKAVVLRSLMKDCFWPIADRVGTENFNPQRPFALVIGEFIRFGPYAR